MDGPVILPGDSEHTAPEGTFVVRLARRRLPGEVALHGESTIPLHPGQLLRCPEDGSRLVVKGIEFVNYSDRIRLPVNPWLIVQTARSPEDFLGRSLPIGEGDAADLE